MSTALAVEYDPRVDGARCDECVLRELRSGPPVRGEFHGACDEALVIAEAPGDAEVDAGRPLVGKSGHELMAGLNSIGVTRTQIALTNAILCQPPNGELDKVLLKLQRENKARLARGEQALPTPMDACRPRLMREVRGFENLIPLGKTGLQTLTGSNRKIMDARGGGIEGIIDTFDGFTTLEREAGSTKVVVIDPKPGDHRVKILPTVHPDFVMRRRQWTAAFRADLGRAFRWFRGALAWVPPRMMFNPSAAELRDFLSRPMRVATPLGDLYGFECDVETTGRPGRKEEAKEPLLAVLRCLGASTIDAGVCCSFQGIDGLTRYYSQDEEMRVVAVWLWFFLHPDLIKFGWNWGYYDRQTIELPGWTLPTGALETAATIDPAALADPHHPFWLQLAERGWGKHRRFGVTPKPILDGIMVHRVVEPGMPHGLGYVGSVNTDVTNWKADHTSTDPKSDQALWIYNITDCAVGARAKPALLAAAHQRNQLHLVPFGHRIQSLCVGLHRNGMRINQDTRKRAEVWLRNATGMYRDEVRKLAGDDGLAVAAKPKKKTDLKAFNPASSHQVKALLFERWGLTPTEYTKLGDPSTGDDALRALIFDPLVPDEQKKTIKAVRKFRGTAKELGTYILPFRMSDEPVNDYDEGLAIYDESTFKDDWERRRRSANDVDDPEEAPRGGLCLVEDGRIHPDYNAHCYDDETEILTRDGWVPFPDLRNGVEVAQWWEDTGAIDFALPSQYRRDFYDGPMVRFENQSADLLMTPYHRMPLVNTKGRVREFTAEKLPRPGGLVSEWSTLHAGRYAGGEGLPLSSAQLRLLTLMQADGCFHESGAAAFGFRKIRKIHRCREILNACGLSYRETPPTEATPEHHFYVRTGDFPANVRELLGEEKAFGPWALRLSRAQIDVVLAEVWHWDSAVDRQTQYSSTKKINTDWIQALLVLSGVRTNQYNAPREPGHAPLNVLGVRRTRRNRITARATNVTEHYRGGIFCVTVPSSWVVVRRRGKVTISGNTAITFRLSSSRPNGQNIPYWIRCLIEAQPGHSIVGADEDQLELRVIADMANLDLYLEIFNYKRRNPTCEQCIKCDPHSLTADVMFQDAWRTASKDQKKKLRDLSKRIKYASFYGSGDETVHGIVTEVEDAQGNFTYANLTIRELALVRRKWLKQFPSLQTWWDATEEECRQNGGFLADPILGVRRDFLNGDDEDYNEKINFKVQTAGALIVHMATEKVLEVMPFAKWGHGTGLIQQGHDALLGEVPDSEVENVEAIFENDMSLTVKQFPNVVFSVKPKSGKTWYEAA